MKIAIAVTTATLLLAGTIAAEAKGPGGKMPPGQMMKKYGSVPGHPGASGWAPGHTKRQPVSTSYRTRRY